MLTMINCSVLNFHGEMMGEAGQKDSGLVKERYILIIIIMIKIIAYAYYMNRSSYAVGES